MREIRRQRFPDIEISLAENTIRAAMHPADEFVTLATLIDGGAMT